MCFENKSMYGSMWGTTQETVARKSFCKMIYLVNSVKPGKNKTIQTKKLKLIFQVCVQLSLIGI